MTRILQFWRLIFYLFFYFTTFTLGDNLFEGNQVTIVQCASQIRIEISGHGLPKGFQSFRHFSDRLSIWSVEKLKNAFTVESIKPSYLAIPCAVC